MRRWGRLALLVCVWIAGCTAVAGPDAAPTPTVRVVVIDVTATPEAAPTATRTQVPATAPVEAAATERSTVAPTATPEPTRRAQPTADGVAAALSPADVAPMVTVAARSGERAADAATAPDRGEVTAAPAVPAADAGSVTGAYIAPEAPAAYATTVTIPTYDFAAGFVPTAEDDPIYPYPRLDFSRVGPPVEKSYDAIVLQNSYVAVTIVPELGGRIYRWVDRTSGRELLYQNPVIKPTSWGYRGWWLAAGGIEWAFPVEEHGLNEWRPWVAEIGTTAYGTAVFVSDIDDRTGMHVGAAISLSADSAAVTLQPWARNDADAAQPYQLWLNAMVALGGETVSPATQFIVPSGQVVVHSTGDGALPGGGGGMGWPVHGGRDMSWYRHWSAYLGFFVPAGSADYVGIYDHAVDQGIVRVLERSGWPTGTKFFGPAGLDPVLWTDGATDYVELWSGATPDFSTYWTMEPGESVGWTEHWYPVSGMGGFSVANRAGALRVAAGADGVDIALRVTRWTEGEMILYRDGAAAARWSVAVAPGQTWRAPGAQAGSGAVGVRLVDGAGNELLRYGGVP